MDKRLGWLAMLLWTSAANALDGTLDTSFGSGGQLVLGYQVAGNEPDQGLAILHDGLGRRIVVVVRRNPFPLGRSRHTTRISSRALRRRIAHCPSTCARSSRTTCAAACSSTASCGWCASSAT